MCVFTDEKMCRPPSPTHTSIIIVATSGKAGKGAVDDKPKTKLMDPIVSMLDMVVRA